MLAHLKTSVLVLDMPLAIVWPRKPFRCPPAVKVGAERFFSFTIIFVPARDMTIKILHAISPFEVAVRNIAFEARIVRLDVFVELVTMQK